MQKARSSRASGLDPSRTMPRVWTQRVGAVPVDQAPQGSGGLGGHCSLRGPGTH